MSLLALNVLGLVAGGVLLYFGAEWLVKGAAGLASAFGVRPLVVGLTVVAYGTSAPELAASLVAALRGHSDIAVGNVIGSNVFNILLILGAASLVHPLHATLGESGFDLAALAGLTVFGAVVLRTERRISRAEGALLVLAYLAFLVVTIWRS